MAVVVVTVMIVVVVGGNFERDVVPVFVERADAAPQSKFGTEISILNLKQRCCSQSRDN